MTATSAPRPYPPPLCPRCADGYPVCADEFTHAETCARYVWADDVCDECKPHMVPLNAVVATWT